MGILCAAGDGAVCPPLQVRPALLRKTLMQTQIVTHTQPQAQASLPTVRFGSLVGLKQLESGHDRPGQSSTGMPASPGLYKKIHGRSLAVAVIAIAYQTVTGGRHLR